MTSISVSLLVLSLLPCIATAAPRSGGGSGRGGGGGGGGIGGSGNDGGNLSTGQILALVFSILGAILFGFILWRYWVWWRQQRDISAQALEYSGNRKSDRPYAIIVAEEDARKQGWWAEANGAGKKWWRGPGKRSKVNDVGAPVTAAGLLAGGLGGQ